MLKKSTFLFLLCFCFTVSTREQRPPHFSQVHHGTPKQQSSHASTTAPQNNSALNSAQSTKTTFLVYIAGDNSLYPFIEYDMNLLCRIGSNKNVNLLAYVNTKLPGKPKTTKKYEIRKGYAKQVGLDVWQDSGDYKTVIKACQWALSSYPADTFILDFWNHGSGSLNRSHLEDEFITHRAVCYDDTTGNFLIDSDLEKIGQAVMQLRKGKKIDIVAFDACLMSDIEIAYVLAPYANYMVASQETIPGEGFAYDQIAAQLATQVSNPKTYALGMVSSYKNMYASYDSLYTMSALDLSQVNALTLNINKLATKLTQLLSTPNASSIKILIQKITSKNCETFDSPMYIDLGNFYTNLLANINKLNLSSDDLISLQDILQTGISLLQSLVISQVHGPDHPQATGISIYLDQQTIDPYYSSLSWANQTSWVSFLHAYLEV